MILVEKQRRYLWNLCGFTRTCLSFNDDDLMVLQGVLNLGKEGKDGKVLSLLQDLVVLLGKGQAIQWICGGMKDHILSILELWLGGLCFRIGFLCIWFLFIKEIKLELFLFIDSQIYTYIDSSLHRVELGWMEKGESVVNEQIMKNEKNG